MLEFDSVPTVKECLAICCDKKLFFEIGVTLNTQFSLIIIYD